MKFIQQVEHSNYFNEITAQGTDSNKRLGKIIKPFLANKACLSETKKALIDINNINY